tara:strand:+ start:2709 stop:3515 length:807 start_codon:yes stop_codon:yes gene_type:complete
MTLRIQKNELTDLLKKAQRKTVHGPLVESCILSHDGEQTLDIVSLVKDGVSSVAKFTVKVNGNAQEIPIPNITDLLGVLKYHGQTVILDYDDNNRLKVKSGSKTTTITASRDAIAYSSSPESIDVWHSHSIKIAHKINTETMSYESANGTIASYFVIVADSTDLFEALRCDGMNGKKTGKYKFIFDADGFHIETGTELKGLTKATINEYDVGKHTMCFEGGLEELMKVVMGEVELGFLHFTERKGAAGEWGLIISMDEDFVFQTSVIA